MAIYVYRSAGGGLVSWDPTPLGLGAAQAAGIVASDARLAAGGLTAADGLPPLDDTHVWDAAAHTVATVASTAPNWIPAYEYVLLFTAAEMQAIRSSADANVQHWMLALSVTQQVNLADPVVIAGHAYLVAQGLLTPANSALILSGQPSQ